MSDSDRDFGVAGAGGPTKNVEEETEAQLEEVDPVAEGKLVRKLDIYLVPIVMLLYLLSFLDR